MKKHGSRKRASTAAASSIIIKRQKLANSEKKGKGYAITFCYATNVFIQNHCYVK